MPLRRRSLLAAAAAGGLLPLAPAAAAPEKFTVLLDWFVNPDHAPLFTARTIGAFAQAGLDVDLIPLPIPTCRPACSPPARPTPRSATRASSTCWWTRACPSAAPAR